jgi:hypothetical protein
MSAPRGSEDESRDRSWSSVPMRDPSRAPRWSRSPGRRSWCLTNSRRSRLRVRNRQRQDLVLGMRRAATSRGHRGSGNIARWLGLVGGSRAPWTPRHRRLTDTLAAGNRPTLDDQQTDEGTYVHEGDLSRGVTTDPLRYRQSCQHVGVAERPSVGLCRPGQQMRRTQRGLGRGSASLNRPGLPKNDQQQGRANGDCVFGLPARAART